MQCAHLSGKILDGLEQVNWNFLWRSSETTKKVHWIGWQKVMRAKDEGGLRLQTVKERNIALLAKLNWRLNTEKETPWAKVLKAKYCNCRRVYTPNANRLPYSCVWAAIKQGREVFTKGSIWMVGRDSKLNF